MGITVGLAPWSVLYRPANNYAIEDIDFNQPLIFLFHGFNVEKETAKSNQYKPFRENLSNLGIKFNIVEVYWYEKKSIRLIKQWREGMEEYVKQVYNAIDCGIELAEFLVSVLQKVSNKQANEIILIGHSLGCRLIIETILNTTNLSIQQRKRLLGSITIMLMGAAIDVSLLNNQNLSNGISGLRQAIVLYSQNDYVLKFIFPSAEEKIYLEEGINSPNNISAVGLNGEPSQIWHSNKDFLEARIPINYIDHNVYWKKKKTVDRIAQFLGRSMIERQIDGRPEPGT